MTFHVASVVPFVDDDFLVRQRAELSARRAAYLEQVERLGAAAEELAASTGEPDLGDDQGFAEADPISVEREHVLSLGMLARKRLEDVDAAIRRLEAGSYGACRTCRRAIPQARLDALPEATQCVSCAGGTALRRR
jgi:RNA polymerase-binding transcription factor DksA